MPLAQQRISRDRQNFEGALNASEVASLANDPDLRVLQTSSQIASSTWSLLNEKLFALRGDIELRVYGFYSSVCDLSFLPLMKNVRHFSADCLMKARGVEHLGELENLNSLSVGIYELQSFDFLKDLPTTKIQKLSLCLTKSKKPRLDLVERFENLKTLYLEGQQNGIEAISSLAKLEDLTLRSVSPAGLAFVRPLNNLRSLDIKLGGIQDLSSLAGLNQIRYLELWQVKGLSDLGALSEMCGLQYLFLQSLRNVKAIPNLSKLALLRRIYFENMKGLKSLSGVSTAPALEEFAHASAIGMEPEDYIEVVNMRSLKKATVWFGSDRKNLRFRQLAESRGIEEYKHHAFDFING